MFGAHVGVTSFAMFYGFFEVLFGFVQMRAFASHFCKLELRFRMCHELLSKTLFAMVHRFLRVLDSFPDVTGVEGWAYSMGTLTNAPSATRIRAPR